MVFISHVVVFIRAHLYARMVLHIHQAFIDFFQNTSIKFIEHLLDIGTGFGRAFKEVDFVFPGKLEALFIGNLSVLFLIVLITDQNKEEVLMAKGLGLLEPLQDMGEALAAGDVVAQDCSDGIFVVAPGDRLEALLACLHGK
jgi:hypothetical protein